jgi:hypothetical protein
MLTLSPENIAEVEEIMDSDQIVRSRFAQFLDFVDTCGRTLPSPSPAKHRYTDLMAGLADALSDCMPMERSIGDDPFI